MKKFIALILILMLAYSCSFEYKALKLYQEKLPKTNILILLPDELLKINAKSDIDYTKVSWNKYDSLIQISDFLHHIDDTAFISSYKQNLKTNFQKVGYNVYFEENWNKFKNDTSAYIVLDFKQWELEEKFIDKQFYDVIGEYQYEENLVLNALSFNVWVEINSTDTLYSFSKTLFIDNSIKDDVEGYFVMNLFNENATFNYTYDSLKIDNLSSLPVSAAKNTVKEISFYNLNKYMKLRLDKKYGREPDSYYIFSDDYKHIYPSPFPSNDNITIVKDFK